MSYVFAAGLLLIVAGTFMLSAPAALIVTGAALATIAIAIERGRRT